MNKKPIIIAGLAVATAFSILFVAANNKSFAFGPMAEGNPQVLNLQPTTLSSMKDVDGNSLNPQGAQSYTPQYFALDDYTTIKTVYATKHNDSLIRLNARPSENDEPSSFTKEEPSYGVTSLTIRVNDGSVKVLVGFEPDNYTYSYSLTKPSSGNKDITIPTRGNYFKVVNTSGANAVVHKFILNYGCTLESYDSDSYTMANGNNATVHANTDKWYYNQNGSTKVGTTTHTASAFTSTITTLASGNGVQYRYEPIMNDNLNNGYTVSFTVEFSKEAVLKRGTTLETVPANTPTDFVSNNRTASSTTSTDTTIFSVVLSGDTDESNVVVKITNIVLNRTVKYS